MHINQAEKQALLTLKLRAGLAETEGQAKIDKALVFTRTKHGADRVVRHLVSAGVNAAAIHGNKSQAQRTAALLAFRKGATPVLVATDIAARGIDVTGVSHVFNFEMPNVAEQYVHRIGRTARAGADGVSISFVAPDEKPYLKDIERLTKVQLMPMPLPEDFQREASRLPLPTRKPDEQAQDARRDARDAKGRGGQRSGGGNHSGGGGRNSNVSRGGQGRDGLSRDASARAERIAHPHDRAHGERGPVSNPLGAAPRRDAAIVPRRDAVTPVRRDGAPAPRPSTGGDRRPAGRSFGGERGRGPRG
jgi:ATP-dependent RNA helicase RhlE